MKAYWKRNIVIFSVTLFSHITLWQLTTIPWWILTIFFYDLLFQLTALSIKWQDFDSEETDKV